MGGFNFGMRLLLLGSILVGNGVTGGEHSGVQHQLGIQGVWASDQLDTPSHTATTSGLISILLAIGKFWPATLPPLLPSHLSAT